MSLEVGRRISRAEALQLARQTLVRAEQERAQEQRVEFRETTEMYIHDETDEEVIDSLRDDVAECASKIDDLHRQLAAVTAERDAARACLQEIGEWASLCRQGNAYLDVRTLQDMVSAALRESEKEGNQQ